jgi:hypothetical protein
MYNESINNSTDTDNTDSLSRLEQAYINSFEYQCIDRQKNWIVIGVATTWLVVFIALFFISL